MASGGSSKRACPKARWPGNLLQVGGTRARVGLAQASVGLVQAFMGPESNIGSGTSLSAHNARLLANQRAGNKYYSHSQRGRHNIK